MSFNLQAAQAAQSIFFPMILPGWNDSLGKANQRYGPTNAYAIMKVKIETDLGYYIKWAMLAQRLLPMKAVRMDYLWKEKDRRRDPSNIISAKKYIEDALVTAGILPGDGQKVIKGIKDHWEVDAQHPGVLVTLTPSYPNCLE